MYVRICGILASVAELARRADVFVTSDDERGYRPLVVGGAAVLALVLALGRLEVL